jgi:hypothetical protein
MVVLVDLDEEPQDSWTSGPHLRHDDTHAFDNVFDGKLREQALMNTSAPLREAGQEERPNPNINGFSAILSCYPYATSTSEPSWTELTCRFGTFTASCPRWVACLI